MFSSTVSEVQQCIDDHPNANGLVLIFTNDYNEPLSGCKLEALAECHKDGGEMKKTFCNVFGFACLWKQNCTAARTTRLLEHMGNCEYPPSYKCLAVVFSGHGEENVLLGCDGKHISVQEDVIGPLQPSELPQMRDIPKLFFIDACRGRRKMVPAVKSKGSGVEKGGYLVAYSTTLGYRSYTYGEKSKWMPKVAHKLRSSNKSVQDIVAEVAKELRMDTNDMQSPEYVGSCEPVFLHQLIDNGKSAHPSCSHHQTVTFYSVESTVEVIAEGKEMQSPDSNGDGNVRHYLFFNVPGSQEVRQFIERARKTSISESITSANYSYSAVWTCTLVQAVH